MIEIKDKKVNISSKIFVDGGDPVETEKAKSLLGFVDGQTTNPTLISKNPEVQRRIREGGKFTREEINLFYKKIVAEIYKITNGPISIEVYADKNTKSEEMLNEARELRKWTENNYIKIPITKEGLRAAQKAIQEDIPINMTLCFSQEQAAAVYSATKGAKKPVFVSPFIGRLDDRGENGMNLVENILKMYQKGDGHVLLLAASIRSLDHLLAAIKLSAPIITVPLMIIQEWAEKNFILPKENFNYRPSNLKDIPYKEISLEKDWQDYEINHELTEVGLERFSTDWEKLLG